MIEKSNDQSEKIELPPIPISFDALNQSIESSRTVDDFKNTLLLIEQSYSSLSILNSSFVPPKILNVDLFKEEIFIDPKDIEIVVSETGCTPEKAEEMLRLHNNDIVTIVLQLGDQQQQQPPQQQNYSGNKECEKITISTVLDINQVYLTYKVIFYRLIH